jgi:hypothetical protein
VQRVAADAAILGGWSANPTLLMPSATGFQQALLFSGLVGSRSQSENEITRSLELMPTPMLI